MNHKKIGDVVRPAEFPETPSAQGVGSLDLSAFVEIGGDDRVVLHPRVIRHFKELEPAIIYIAQMVASILTQEQPDKDVDRTIRALQEGIACVFAKIDLVDRFEDYPGISALLEGQPIPCNNRAIKRLAKAALNASLSLGIISSMTEIQTVTGVNAGQVKKFMTTGKYLMVDRILKCLEFVAGKAKEKGLLEDLKRKTFPSGEK